MVASCWEWWEEKGRSGIFVMAEQILIRTVVTQSYTCDKMWQKCTHPVPTSQAWALMLHWSSIHTYWGCEWKVHGNTLPAAAAKSLRLCPTLWDSIDGSPPGSPVPGILQARTLEWVVISSSNAWKWKVKVKMLSHIRLLATPWTAAYQVPPSMGFSRQEYWSGVPLPSLTLFL